MHDYLVNVYTTDGRIRCHGYGPNRRKLPIKSQTWDGIPRKGTLKRTYMTCIGKPKYDKLSSNVTGRYDNAPALARDKLHCKLLNGIYRLHTQSLIFSKSWNWLPQNIADYIPPYIAVIIYARKSNRTVGKCGKVRSQQLSRPVSQVWFTGNKLC